MLCIMTWQELDHSWRAEHESGPRFSAWGPMESKVLRSGGELFTWKLLHDETSSYSDLPLNSTEGVSYFLPMLGTGLTLPDSLTASSRSKPLHQGFEPLLSQIISFLQLETEPRTWDQKYSFQNTDLCHNQRSACCNKDQRSPATAKTWHSQKKKRL